MKETPITAEQFFYAQLGARIRKARDKRGWTQDVLAATVGLKRTSIANLERGRQRLLLHTFVNLARALKAEPADLLRGQSRAPNERNQDLQPGLPPSEAAFIQHVIHSIADTRKK